MKAGDWSWLEVAKLSLGALTPLAVFYLTLATAEALRESQDTTLRQEAVEALARDIYSRRVRAELLSSSLRRHVADPAEQSTKEVIDRKIAYDEAYAEWNRSSQANLLSVRRFLSSESYTRMESVIEAQLVGRGFSPLDACLTLAYDESIRGANPLPTLDQCDTRRLLSFVTNCGYAITDELFKAADSSPQSRDADAFASGQIRTRCASDY